MKTRETTIPVGDGYKVMFSVFDDSSWIVTIQNDELEFGASGDQCTGNWNNGLASAFESIAEMMPESDAFALLDRLKASKDIDSGFIRYLNPPWRELSEKEMDALEALWESTWIDGPQ